MATPKKRRPSRSRAQRPPFVRIPDDTRRLATLLGDEMLSFPGVTTRPMFGFVGYYRDGVIFAALPKTRALYSDTSFIFKLNRAPDRILERSRRDSRITVSTKGMQGWQTFELASEQDLRPAQQWLMEAWKWAKTSGQRQATSRKPKA